MTHQHVMQKEPPDAISRTSEDKYGDKRDMAHNSFWTSLEELKRLWLLLDEDPEFEKSSDWPVLVEWCSSCGSTRGVKLVLPKKIKEPGLEVEESTSEVSSCCDASTQTPRQRPRRRGGPCNQGWGWRASGCAWFRLFRQRQMKTKAKTKTNTKINIKYKNTWG